MIGLNYKNVKNDFSNLIKSNLTCFIENTNQLIMMQKFI